MRRRRREGEERRITFLVAISVFVSASRICWPNLSLEGASYPGNAYITKSTCLPQRSLAFGSYEMGIGSEGPGRTEDCSSTCTVWRMLISNVSRHLQDEQVQALHFTAHRLTPITPRACPAEWRANRHLPLATVPVGQSYGISSDSVSSTHPSAMVLRKAATWTLDPTPPSE